MARLRYFVVKIIIEYENLPPNYDQLFAFNSIEKSHKITMC